MLSRLAGRWSAASSAAAARRAVPGACAALAYGGALPLEARRHVRNKLNISVEDAKLLYEEMERRQREIEEAKNEAATEVKVEGPTKWRGDEAIPADAADAPSTADATAEASEEGPTGDDIATSDAGDASSLSQPEPINRTVEVSAPASKEFLYGGIADEQARAARDKAVSELYEKPVVGDVAVARGAMRFLRTEEEFALRLQKVAAKNQQQGPWVGSRAGDVAVHDVDSRSRRAVERIPQMEEQYEANETNFRRLPMKARLPDEFTLRHLYPRRTALPIDWCVADCVDADALDIGNPTPVGIKYGAIYPDDFDPHKTYPLLVVLGDHRGSELDFEDFCANLLEREEFQLGLKEQQFLVLCPMINTRHSIMFPIEGVVARFCDWAVRKYKVEHNKPHLVGKGLGGYLALRCGMEHKALAISVVAILGRMGTAFRPFERPQEKAKNMQNTHSLIYVPGGMRKLEWIYKFKGLLDLAKISPPVRMVHFAEVRDHQVYYALNPNEFWNYLLYFRRHPMHQSVASAGSGRVVEDEEQAATAAAGCKDYSSQSGDDADPLGTITYEWLAGRGTNNEQGKSRVAADGTVV